MECFIDGRLPGAVAQLDRLAHLSVAPGKVLRLWRLRATRGHALAFPGRAADGLAEIEETLVRTRAARPSMPNACGTAPKPWPPSARAPRRWKRRSRQPA